MGFQYCLHVIAYVMSVIGCIHLVLSCFFRMLPFYHIPFVLRRHYLEDRILAVMLYEVIKNTPHYRVGIRGAAIGWLQEKDCMASYFWC